MQVTLKDYQDEAARQILSTLAYCAEDYRRRGARKSFALSSTTGSGKTVIAAAVIEALIHGSTEFDFEPDPGAVVLWISKDPSLNEQSRARIRDVADRIPVSDLVLLDKDFGGDRLEKGTVYFINPAKLSVNGLFVRRTNGRPFTFWDILDNTINDPNLMLYVILDEAHEGMKTVRTSDADDRQSTVMKVINGNGSHPAVPVVMGISATVDRFSQAMAQAVSRGTEPNVVIDPQRVQASGLLKNTLVLDVPDEDGEFVTSMLRDATQEFVAVAQRWAEYTEAEGLEDTVLPLMVIQIPNKVTGSAGEIEEDRTIVTALDIVRNHFPDFTDDCVAHVIGDRDDIELGSYSIPKIKPQDIQASTHVRILIAKDAVSTGWDCPRAEVLYSMRKSDKENRTYIAQLLGRMVRTPLARTTSDDRLNSASCYLPNFDGPTAKSIAEEIMGIKESALGTAAGGGAGPKVLFKPVDLVWNTQIEVEFQEKVRESLENLPSFAKPSSAPKPIRRALSAAVAVGKDELVPHPNKTLLDDLCGVLDGAMAQYANDVDQIAKRIMEAEVKRLSATRGDAQAQEEQIQREADENTVKEAFGTTSRVFTSTIAKAYLKRLYEAAIADDDLEADLVTIQARVAALSRVERSGEAVVVKTLEDAAERQTRAWLDGLEDKIILLSDERRAEYDDIRGQAREPEMVKTILRPIHRVEGGTATGDDLERRSKHVLAGATGGWPVDPTINKWERFALDKELERGSVVAWYRNPSDSGSFSVKIPYRSDGKWRSLQPDFIFFDKNHAGEVVPTIIDPHGGHLTGALERLVGIANYAEEHGDQFARIVCIDEDDDNKFRSLNMKDDAVRQAVLTASDEGKTARDLFNGPLAKNYR